MHDRIFEFRRPTPSYLRHEDIFSGIFALNKIAFDKFLQSHLFCEASGIFLLSTKAP